MATFCGLVSTSRVLGHHSGTRIPFRIQKHGTLVAGNFSPINMVRGLCVNHNFYMHAVSRGSNYMLEFDDKNEMHSTWIDSFKQLIRGLKVVLVFLAAQPSQLRYIEWPSFQSTFYSDEPVNSCDPLSLLQSLIHHLKAATSDAPIFSLCTA